MSAATTAATPINSSMPISRSKINASSASRPKKYPPVRMATAYKAVETGAEAPARPASQPSSNNAPEANEVSTLGLRQGLGGAAMVSPCWGVKPNASSFLRNVSWSVICGAYSRRTLAALG